MSQRVVVMNGQRLFQTEHGGQWRTDRVDRAGNLKPGRYRLDAALPADQSRIHTGVIVHADRQLVYQQAGSTLLRHAGPAFDVLPRAGTAMQIAYADGRAHCQPFAEPVRRGLKM